MAEVPPQKFSIPSCIADEMRQPLSAMAKFLNILRPLAQLITNPAAQTGGVEIGSDIAVDVMALQAFLNDPIGTVGMPVSAVQTFFVEGVLQDDLPKDGTATLYVIDPATESYYSPNVEIEVNGFYVPLGKKIPGTTSTVGAMWNGSKWRVLVSDTCAVNV